QPFLSDRNRVSDIVSDKNEDSARIMSDRKEEQAAIVSGMNTDTPAPHAITPPRARSAKVSDMKGARLSILSDTKGDISPMLSDVKEDARAPAMQEPLADIMSDMKEAHAASTPEPAILS